VLLLGITLLGFSLYLFFELRENLFNQVDHSLQTAVTQALGKLEDTVPPRFVTQRDGGALNVGLLESGVALRLISVSDGTLGGYGDYENLPDWVSLRAGYVTLVSSGAIWRVYSYPVQFHDERVQVWLQVAQSLDDVYDTLDDLLTVMLVGVPAVLVVAMAGGVFLADQALRPVDRMTRIASGVGADRLDRRIDYDGPPDELGRLALTLDDMLERLQIAFETERRFTADASHELRTPLTIIKGHIEVALAYPRHANEYIETLSAIRGENERLIRLVNNLLYLAKLDAASLKASRESVDLTELLGLVVEQMRMLADEKQVMLECECDQLPQITGNTDHLIRLFLNLLDNAVKYTPAGGQVLVKAEQQDGKICIEIRDTGIGISEEHLPHLFKRFYRAKDGFKGVGLGLAIAESIVREHQGELTVSSVLGVGSVFTVRVKR
jgi:heavy metal sensor kinase